MAKLSADQTYVTVEWGDTLSQIANDYKKYTGGKTYQILAKDNDIDNPNLIYVGQKIMLAAKAKSSSNNTSKAVIKHFGLQTKTQRTVFATWTWSKTNTENYQVKWEYDSGDGIWFVGTNSTVDVNQSLYDAPSNANRVRFSVKPISKTRTVNNKESSYWTAGWSTAKTYSFSDNPPETPDVPTVTLDGLKLTAELNNINVNASIIQFALYKDDVKSSTGKAAVKAAHAAFEFKLTPGSIYKVQCRAYKDGDYSEWSDFTTPTGTIPATPKGFTKCILQGDKNTDVYLEWEACKTATSYKIEYTNNQSYFDNPSITIDSVTIEPVKTGDAPPTKTTLVNKFDISSDSDDAGTWYFRLRASNSQGDSGWSEISSTKIGEAPAPPTTWSSTSSVVLGEPLRLYWVHNSEDGSSQTHAQLKLNIDGVVEVIQIENTKDEDEKDKTSSYTVPTSRTGYRKVEFVDGVYVATQESVSEVESYDSIEGAVTDTGLSVYSYNNDGVAVLFCIITEYIYPEGAKIIWQVKTLGEGHDSYSGWSVERVVYIYAQPTIELDVLNSTDRELEVLDRFPFYLKAIAHPATQRPLGFYISIVAQESYTTVDLVGNDKKVVKGEAIYSKYVAEDTLDMVFTPSDVDLENNQPYRIAVTADMNSGLTAEEYFDFEVAWADGDNLYEPNAEISIDDDTYAAYIRPYCEDNNGNLIDGVNLALYRREFDGSFTEIATGLDNTRNTFVTDPHPALDYARYRVVATTRTTGAVTYCDVPGYPVNCKAAIIQWDEQWSTFDTAGNSEAVSDPAWTGSILKLMYNIDISDSNKPDVEFVEYIGREHPVAYYGTHKGHSSNWDMEIPATDKETLYQLRRLQSWMGDVYVREPSGTGYWANVTVSFPIKHRSLTIPISMKVTRVEGGI